MSYIQDLVNGNLKSLTEMLKSTIQKQLISKDEIEKALIAEVTPVPEGGNIYSLSEISNKLLAKLQHSPDRDVLVIVKKIMRSTKYAAVTWYAVTGIDSNPHKIPVTPYNQLTNLHDLPK